MVEKKTPRRMGIIRNPDGTLTTSLCRAKEGNEGKGKCHHFAHGTSAEMKALVAEYTMKKESGMLDGVDYPRDMKSVKLSLREYLISAGYSPQKLKETGSIEDDWFGGDREAYLKALGDAADEGPLGDLKSSEEVVEAVKDLTDKGIKVEVTTDRMVGLRDDSDTEIWGDLNGVSGLDLEGEAPVVIMSGSGDYEQPASESVREKGSVRVKPLDDEEREELKDMGYVSTR